jgi:hypothetical protein
MENVLNRRMFQQPIYAKSGVYVPTIEQIMNFYGGGFGEDGVPKDMEAFQTAIENANKANEAGLFDWYGEGQPIDSNWFTTRRSTGEFLKKHGLEMYDPIFDMYNTPGGMVKPSEKHEEFLKNYLLEKEKELQMINKQDLSTDEGAQVESDLTVYDAANLPPEVAAEIAKKDKMEDEEAQRLLGIANQKELFELLQQAKVKNLAGETEREVSGDENIEIIKRNILQGTNIVEPGTEEFKNLSAADRMKVKDAISEKRKEEVDLTDVSEKGMQNIIEAAGESVEVALDIYNDMKNFGGEVGEAAGEFIDGWKKAISSGWSDERKQELNEQIDYLKSKKQESTTTIEEAEAAFPTTSSIFGVDIDDLKKGSKKVTDWYKDSIIPEAIEGGADIIQNVFGASDVANAELSKENQLLQDKIIEDQKLEDMRSVEEEYLKASGAADSVDTSIFKEAIEGGTDAVKKTVDSLNAQVDKLFSDRDNNIIDAETFKEGLNFINDKKNELLDKFDDTGAGKWLDKKTEEVSDYLKDKGQELSDFRKQALEDGADLNEDGKVGPIELFEYHLKQKRIEKQKQEGMRSVEEEYLKASGLDEQRKKKAEEIVEKSKVTEDDGVATIEDTEQEIVTTDEVADGDKAINKADTAAATAGTDTVGLGAADEAVPAGTSAMAQLIAETAKETGYNFGALDQTKDDLALKTIMYGLKLAMTPGKFHEAVLGTGFEAVRNEINERYKTKAAKQKFAGTLFNTMLAGKLDIEKERVKAANKKTVPKKYDFGTNFQKDVLLKIATGNPEKGLGFDLSGLGLDEDISEENKGAKMFVLDIMNEMQMLANKAVTGGELPPSQDILFNQAYENISPVYKIVTKDLFSIMYTLDKELLGDWLPGDWKQPKETTIERLRDQDTAGATSTVSTISAAEREKILEQFKDFPVTEAIVKQQMKEHNKTRDEVIAEFEKVGADVSEVK